MKLKSTYLNDKYFFYHKIIKDHKIKSSQVRELKRKLKCRVPIEKLEVMLAQEKKQEINGWHYQGIYGFDDEGYKRDVAKKEARIELFEELIDMK